MLYVSLAVFRTLSENIFLWLYTLSYVLIYYFTTPPQKYQCVPKIVFQGIWTMQEDELHSDLSFSAFWEISRAEAEIMTFTW